MRNLNKIFFVYVKINLEKLFEVDIFLVKEILEYIRL